MSKRAFSQCVYSTIALLAGFPIIYDSMLHGSQQYRLFMTIGLALPVIALAYSPLKWYLVARIEYIELEPAKIIFRNWYGRIQVLSNAGNPVLIKDWTSGWSFSPVRYLLKFPTASVSFYSNINNVEELLSNFGLPPPSARDRLWKGQYGKKYRS